MLSPASSLVVSLCQLQSLASSLPTEIFEGKTGRGPDLVWTTSQRGLSIEAADGSGAEPFFPPGVRFSHSLSSFSSPFLH